MGGILSGCICRKLVAIRGEKHQKEMLHLQSANCCNFTLILICNSLDVLIELVGDMEDFFVTSAAEAVVNMESCYCRPASAVPALYPMVVNLRYEERHNRVRPYLLHIKDLFDRRT